MLGTPYDRRAWRAALLAGVLILSCRPAALAQPADGPAGPAQPGQIESVDLLAGVVILNPGSAEVAAKTLKKKKANKPRDGAVPVAAVRPKPPRAKLVRSAAPVKVQPLKPAPRPRRPTKRKPPAKSWTANVFNNDN